MPRVFSNPAKHQPEAEFAAAIHTGGEKPSAKHASTAAGASG